MMFGCVAFMASVSAQTTTMSDKNRKDGDKMEASTVSNEVDSKQAMEDIERYLSSALEMEYRNSTIKSLGLTSEEIEEFDPIFRDYVDAKKDMIRKKMRMFQDFREEMDEDDSPENIEEDKADFIEDYMEFRADEIEMRKNYFDRLEDKIAVDKALQFIMMEEAEESKTQREVMIRMVPVLINVNEMPSFMQEDYRTSSSYNYDSKNGQAYTVSNVDAVGQAKSAIKEFNSWVMKRDGKMSLSHDYTYNGIEALVGVIESIDNTMNNDIDVVSKKKDIMDVAGKLKIKKYGDEHADAAKKVFTHIAKLMNNVTGSNDMSLMNIAEKIDKDVLLLDQSAHVYNFFETANNQLKNIEL